MPCTARQTEMAEVVRNKNANYVLQVKNNQKKLNQEIEAYFHKVRRDTPALIEENHFYEVDGEHGRINERHYRMLPVGLMKLKSLKIALLLLKLNEHALLST